MARTYTAYCDTKEQAKDYIYSLKDTEFKVKSYGYKDGKFYIVVEY